MSKHDFTATDGIVKAYAALIALPKAPLLEAWWAAITASRYSPGKPETILVVTSNSKVWSYGLRPRYEEHEREKPSTFDPQGVWVGGKTLDLLFPANFVSRELHQRKKISTRASLESGYREPVAWAMHDMARRARLPAAHPDALQLNVGYEMAAPAELGARRPGPCGPIQYTGYPARVGAYSLDQIHQMVCEAITACLPHWNWRSAGNPPWRPNSLEIMLHTGNRALGLAYAPGTGKDTNKRLISLNDLLFKQYDAKATWRVVVHELCHHYRDEAIPRNEMDADASERLRQSITTRLTTHQLTGANARAQIKYRQQLEGALRTHDGIFVRELAKVDPAVAAEPATGMLFTEYADPSLVAEITAKKQAKLAKIDWSPDHGRLHIHRLKDGTVSMQWLPLVAGQWRAPVVKLSSGEACRQLLLATIAARCTLEGWPEAAQPVDRVSEFVDFIQRRMGLFTRGLN